MPPEILPFGFPEEVREGQLIQISCTAMGDDPITLQWYKDDLPLMSSAKYIINSVDSKLSNLVLRGVVSEHSGKYACAAFSPVGEARYEKELRVKGKIFVRSSSGTKDIYSFFLFIHFVFICMEEKSVACCLL